MGRGRATRNSRRAGDLYVHLATAEQMNTKKQREQDAANKLRQEFADFREIHELIERYEAKEDSESTFVYSLDKLLPVIGAYLNKGYDVKEDNISLTKMEAYNGEKIAKVPELKKLYDELIMLLKNHPEFFSSTEIKP